MKLFWKTVGATHELCIEPAAKLLTMKELPMGRWSFECLAEKKFAQRGGLEDAKQMAYVFLEGMIAEVQKELAKL